MGPVNRSVCQPIGHQSIELVMPRLDERYVAVCLLVCLAAYPSVCRSVCLSLSLSLPVCLSVCLYVCMFVCLSVGLSVWLSVCGAAQISYCSQNWRSIRRERQNIERGARQNDSELDSQREIHIQIDYRESDMLTETDTGRARYNERHRQIQPERTIERQIERERERHTW